MRKAIEPYNGFRKATEDSYNDSNPMLDMVVYDMLQKPYENFGDILKLLSPDQREYIFKKLKHSVDR